MFSMDQKLSQIFDAYQGVPFTFIDWTDKRRLVGTGEPRFAIQFKTRDALVHTIAEGTLLGIGEAYMNGSVVIPEGDLEDALTALNGIYRTLPRQSSWVNWVGKLWARTLPRQKMDIEHHYGLGDDFYRFYLDKGLQYSCAYFRNPEDSLDQAQEQKIAHTIAKLDLRPGQRLLDIGCGWGHLMFHAASQYGVKCLGITLCDNQAKYIREQAAARNLPVEVRVMNYLELDEAAKWERVVSVGMMCHVGEKHAEQFFDKIKALLAPGAVCLLHCITQTKERPGSEPFTSKYIFPGFWFFSLEGMTRRAADREMIVMDVENLRRHYALTAHHWRANFLRNLHEIKRTMRFSDTFLRAWEFYLASVVAGFRTGEITLTQMVLSNGVNDEYPWTREFLYAEREGAVPAAPDGE